MPNLVIVVRLAMIATLVKGVSVAFADQGSQATPRNRILDASNQIMPGNNLPMDFTAAISFAISVVRSQMAPNL